VSQFNEPADPPHGAAGGGAPCKGAAAPPSSDQCDRRDAEVDAALRFLLVPGIGVGRMRLLRESYGTFAAALLADAAGAAVALRVDPAEAARLLAAARRADDALGIEREQARRSGVAFRLLSDRDYPELLRASPDPPELLFVRGELDAAPEAAVAIVGSRRAMSVALAEHGMTIVSGGARGIDAEAHRGALRAGGRTIAVLATGFAHPYPSEHVGLFESIVEGGGALVTEQPSFVTARPDLFPRRNRVIASLSLVTVVVEAALRSGALLTARIAVDDLSRDVGCVPGPVTSALSAGCHRAIREGWATLVTCADDVVAMLAGARTLVSGAQEAAQRVRADPKPPALTPRASSRAVQRETPRSNDAPMRSKDASELSAAIHRLGRAGFDELERELAWTVPRIATAALELELLGLAERDAEGAFRVKSRRLA
jgi:DNA processing protein